MIATKSNKGTLEEKIYELICEYGALKAEQVRRYFNLEEAHLEKMAVKLIKKGRLNYDRQNGYLKIPTITEYNECMIRCFWVVLDLIDTMEFHGAGKYPLYLALYADGKAYEVYCCKKGEEMALEHALERLQEEAEGKVMIVIKDLEQIQRFHREDYTFCMVDEEGGVRYFE